MLCEHLNRHTIEECSNLDGHASLPFLEPEDCDGPE